MSLVTATEAYLETVRPVGASVTVVSATAKTINVKAKITLKSGYTITNVKAAIVAAITDYLRNFRLSGTASLIRAYRRYRPQRGWRRRLQ